MLSFPYLPGWGEISITEAWWLINFYVLDGLVETKLIFYILHHCHIEMPLKPGPIQYEMKWHKADIGYNISWWLNVELR